MNWRDLVELVRAPAALSVPGDVIAGAAAARTLGGRTAGLAGSSVLLYWAGMAANDWADRELDAIERPGRPIPSGRVNPNLALGIATGLTAAGVAIAGAVGGRKALGVAVPLAGAVWAYDLVLKNTPAGPAAMATCRALDVLLGASGGRMRRALMPAATVFAHTYTVTALSRAEVHGATPELPAATMAGTAAVAVAAAALGSPAPLKDDKSDISGHEVSGYIRNSSRRGIRLAAAVGLAGWYAKRYGEAQLTAFDKPSAENIRKAVGAGIVNLPTLQGALTARAGAPLTGVLVAAAAPLAKALAKKVSPT